MSIKIVTHSQHFHIDELFAIVFLKMYVDKNIDVVRTRDEKLLSEYKTDKDVWVIDVGGEYDPEMKNFDHHQKSFKGAWEDGTPLSSCGLIWHYLKENNLLSQHMNGETIDKIEKDIVKKVDKQDNGIEFWQEAYFISIYNTKTNDEKKLKYSFDRALEVTNDFYKNLFGVIRRSLRAEREVKKVIDKSKEFENVIVMDSHNMDMMKILHSYTDKTIAVLPYKGKEIWKICSITNGNSFSKRSEMPKDWLGLSGKKLETVSGVKGLEFCHKAGFMCVYKGLKEEAINIANNIYLYNLACMRKQ